MQIKFIGDREGQGPAVLKTRGYAFPKGEWVEVEDASDAAFFAGNWHFEAKDGAVIVPHLSDAPEADEPDPIGALNAESLDWRGLDKTGLDDFAKSLGVTLDKRKSLPNMQTEFETALDNLAPAAE
jgi:hypothetical protein